MDCLSRLRSSLSGRAEKSLTSLSVHHGVHHGLLGRLLALEPRNDGFAELHPHRLELSELLHPQIRVTLGQVFDGLRHPRILVVLMRLQYSAAVNVTEQFVSRPFHRLLLRHYSSSLLVVLAAGRRPPARHHAARTKPIR